MNLHYDMMKIDINIKNYQEIKNKLKNLYDDFHTFYDQVSSENKSWNIDDVRFSLISKPMNVILATLVGFEPLLTTLQTGKWFIETFPDKFTQTVPVEIVTRFHDAYDAYLRRSLISDFYGSFESTFRLIAGPEGLNVVSNNAIVFSRIYPHLLSRLQLTRHMNLMMVWGIIRNAVHTNTIYNPPVSNPQDLVFQYKYEKYTFEIGKPVKKSSWDDLVNYSDAYLELIKTMIARTEIKNMNELLETSAKFHPIGPTEEEFQKLVEQFPKDDTKG